MKLKIQNWGGEAAVRLSRSVRLRLGVKIGDFLDVNLLAGKVVLRKSPLKYNLSDLMAEMPDGLPRISGWDELPAVGKESS